MSIKEISKRIIDLYEQKDLTNEDRSLLTQYACRLRSEIEPENFTNDSLVQILKAAKKIASTKKRIATNFGKRIIRYNFFFTKYIMG